MKTYLNNYTESSEVRHIAKHITTKANLIRILNGGLKPNTSEGYLYLYVDGTIFNQEYYIGYSVRDAIAYNQLFLCEGDEAIEFTVDITEQVKKGEIWGELCIEATQSYHRIIKDVITPDKIISYEAFRVIDPFKRLRPKFFDRSNPILPSNNKIQKQLQKTRHNRKNFARTLIELPSSKGE